MMRWSYPSRTRPGWATRQRCCYEFGDGDYWDENTGEQLPTKLVETSRGEELEFMKKWQVWEEVPVAECLQRTGKKPLGSKWVDVNKGDRTSPDVRSRLVAREIAYHKNDDFYAATPPFWRRCGCSCPSRPRPAGARFW